MPKQSITLYPAEAEGLELLDVAAQQLQAQLSSLQRRYNIAVHGVFERAGRPVPLRVSVLREETAEGFVLVWEDPPESPPKDVEGPDGG